MSSAGFESARPWLKHLVGMEVLAAAATALQREGIDVMPLKGAWLHLAGVYDAPELRPISDVDALVRPVDHARAVSALAAQGFVVRAAQGWQTSLARPGDALALDLHREIFDPLCFGLSAADLWARAVPGAPLRGSPLWMPAPLDAFGHLVGHYLRSGPAGRDEAHRADFEAMLAHFDWAPGRVADYLRDHGLARAARLCLSASSAEAPAVRSQAVLAALGRDPLGHALTRLVAGMERVPGLPRRAHAISGLLLARSLPAGVEAIARRGASRLVARGPRTG